MQPTPQQNLATEEGIRQLSAAIALMCSSKLVKFDLVSRTFTPASEGDFEAEARNLHPNFGRVMLWILFSAGAEYLLKASLIFPGLLEPTTQQKPGIPAKGTPWTSDWLNSAQPVSVNNFKTMGYAKTQLDALFNLHTTVSEDDRLRVKQTYDLLTDSIRNRDAHAYVQGVRAAHHHVLSTFCPAFNTLLSLVDADAFGGALVLAIPNSQRAI